MVEESSSSQQWQEKLLPFMVRMVFGLTLFFFIASCVQLIYLHWNIKNSPKLDLDLSSLNSSSVDAADVKQKLETAKLQALVYLEAYSIRRHTHQANVLLMARVWTRYLGFVTGMILSLVGAAFILGKLQIASTDVNARVQMAELSIKSSSPGLVLVILGVVLMLVTIVTHHQIETTDVPVYLKNANSFETSELSRPPTPQLPKIDK